MMTTSGAGFGRKAMDVGKHIESVAVGQPDVEEYDVIGRVFNEHEGLSRGGAGVATPYPSSRRISSSEVQNFRFVVDHQDVIHAGALR